MSKKSSKVGRRTLWINKELSSTRRYTGARIQATWKKYRDFSELGPSGVQSGQGDVKDSKNGSFKYVTTKENLKNMWAGY